MALRVEVRIDILARDQRRYHTDPQTRISQYVLTTSFTPPDYDEGELDRIGPTGSFLVKEIGKLPGIKEIKIGPSSLTVVLKKGGSFQEIEPQILEALEKALGESEN